MYGFIRMDAQNLAVVHLLPSVFETSVLYNVLNHAAMIQAGLDMSPQDQTFHPYVPAMMLGMTNSACWCTIVLPMESHQELVEHFFHGIDLKSFYDHFLSTVGAGECQILNGVFTWWRHAASRTANTCGGVLRTASGHPTGLISNGMLNTWHLGSCRGGQDLEAIVARIALY